MKVLNHKGKSVIALTLAMAMFCPQVYAGALSATAQGVQEAPVAVLTEAEVQAQAIPELTVEMALEKALKHSPDLQDLEDSLELLKDNDEKIYDRVGSVNVPNYENTRWLSDETHALISTVFQIEQGLQQAKIGKELQKMVLEVTVKTYFTTIISIEDGLELARANADMQQKLYEQGYTKYRLGMLSKYNLDQLQVKAQQAKDTVAKTEASLEQMYNTFNNIIGEKTEARFDFVYDVTFTPYEMDLPMDQYIRNKMGDDLMLQMQELTVESAKFARNLRNYTNAQDTYSSDKLTYEQKKRALNTAKADKEVAIQNTYLKIKALETDYSTALSNLTKAEADLRVAQLSYQTGAVTKMAVAGAEMAVVSAQNALKSVVYEHNMLIYQFENPSILSSGQ